MSAHLSRNAARAEKIMIGRLRSQRGMSLVEATIILMVLATLTAVLAPAMGDYVEDARNTKAKEDVEAIGTAILRLTRDTGQPCLQLAAGACTLANRIDLLVGAGNTPAIDTSAGFAVNYTFTADNSADGAVAENWLSTGAGITAMTKQDTLDNQFVTNAPVYSGPDFTKGGGPKSGLGWRGAYLTGPIGGDPWGFKYQANTVFLTVATNATGNTGEGEINGGWSSDVIVISGGSNGTLQTAVGSLGGTAKGDDITFVLQGSTR
jgi:type II secretory pathway pseudopilin PulG